ncbi:hormogonium polysaccharide biosynthesis protein HpsA, partial [Planktothrix sp.]|uniref:hormogonium polysaccharide biosynthesis protein HpsA n=1 Tax=Planktothrix sp. TaxID=3088171 RepID=UPI0038D43E43
LNPNKTQQITDAGANNNRTVTNNSLQVLSNSQAYEDRLSYLVSQAPATLFNEITDPDKRNKALRTYFEDRVRKVPYQEVDESLNPPKLNTMQPLTISGTVVKPPNTWIYPSKIDNNSGGKNADISDTTDFNKLTATTTPGYRMEASNPEGLSVENYLGDRILVGNGLPLKWYINNQEVSGSTPQFLFEGTPTPLYWTGSTEPRYRQTRVQELPDVGSTDRDGFWEIAAGTAPINDQDPYGGLRVITGAGVYNRSESFLPPPQLTANGTTVVAATYDDPATTATETYTIVWPDTMPMSPPTIGKVFTNKGLYKADGTPETAPKLDGVATDAGSGSRWKEYSDTSYWTSGNPAPTKGDLQMRASVVYHYAAENGSFSKEKGQEANQTGNWDQVKQTPIACVSSYYDPSTALTAKNGKAQDGTTDLPWNFATGGKSNNGIVYGPPAAPDWTELERQANMVFPDGRFVNPMLREAVQHKNGDLTLAEQAAVDSTMCALGILDDSLSVQSSPGIPHGAIREVTFLNGRETKAKDADSSKTTIDETFTLDWSKNSSGLRALDLVNSPKDIVGSYQLPLEHRQPLEIRATVLDLNQLRQATITQTTDGPKNGNNEYMLPFSGIIYASRDDALPDLSTADTETLPSLGKPNTAVSATDGFTDPTRRPNGIMVINGKCLARGTANCQNTSAGVTVPDLVKEKGLTLVSNISVYIKGQFNPHTKEEFQTPLSAVDWANFYTRASGAIGKTASTITKTDRNLDPNFACRAHDPRLPDCTTGDDWRPATILADSVTVLSGTTETQGFRWGFRNEGDFDLRNNAGVAKVGYDLDGNGNIETTSMVNESTFGFDLNGNGTTNDTNVKEVDITAKAAILILLF